MEVHWRSDPHLILVIIVFESVKTLQQNQGRAQWMNGRKVELSLASAGQDQQFINSNGHFGNLLTATQELDL